jgi:transcriptional regulator with XRE-family HTH domain
MGDCLRTSRESHHLSTQAAAEQAGISPGYLFKLENGYVGTPSPRVLDRLASVLDIDYWQLIGLAGYPVPVPGTGRVSAPIPAPDPLDRIADALSAIHSELRAIRQHMEPAAERSARPKDVDSDTGSPPAP